MAVGTGHTQHRSSAVLALAARVDGHSSAVLYPTGAVSTKIPLANAPTGAARAVETVVAHLTATMRAVIAWFLAIDTDVAPKDTGGPP